MRTLAEQEFEHKPTVWTVGDLRRALADTAIPDDMALEFHVAEEPGGEFFGTQIAFDAERGQGWDSKQGKEYPAFLVSLEFPPGTYIRRVD